MLWIFKRTRDNVQFICLGKVNISWLSATIEES